MRSAAPALRRVRSHAKMIAFTRGVAMIFSLATYTWIHVAISLVALVAGFAAVLQLFAPRQQDGWTWVFLITIVLTSVTGFGFPFDKFLPSHWTGVISLVILAAAIAARQVFHLGGQWRWVYAAGVVLAAYLNTFVAIVQAFQKIPALHALAPTQSEAPFAIVQGIVLVVFVALAIAAGIRFRPPAIAPAV
jgi:hypothetical protein